MKRKKGQQRIHPAPTSDPACRELLGSVRPRDIMAARRDRVAAALAKAAKKADK